MENAFKQWLVDNYEHNELADIANHGCAGGVGGMIYYRETMALYARFADDLHELLAEYKDQTGELPPKVLEALTESAASFQNILVWFGAEWVANELTHGEYVEETTDA